MRVAIVLTTEWWRGSIDHDGYAASMRAMGLDPVLVCLGVGLDNADYQVIVASEKEYYSEVFWRSLGLDRAIVWNWLRGSQLLTALRMASVKTVVRGDTDGMISSRVFPIESFVRTVANGEGVRSRAGLAKFFFLNAWPNAYMEDREFLKTVQLADAVAVETPIARIGLAKVLNYYGRPDQIRKIHVVPHSVRDVFSRFTIPAEFTRPRQVLASGRWDSSQKHVELLFKTVRQLLRRDPDLSIVVSGPLKVSLATVVESFGERERLTFLGRISTDEMIGQLSRSRVLLSTSRWETHPIGALEAICLGCRVVAPPIRGFVDLLSDNRFGSLAQRRTAASLTKAVIGELDKPPLISSIGANGIGEFQRSVSNDRVVKDLLGSISCTDASSLP